MNRELIQKIGIGALVVVVLLVWRQYAIHNTGDSDPRIGESAPYFNLPSLHDPEQRVALTDFRGEPVLLDFWSITCPPCIEEMRHLRTLYRESDESLNIVSINIDIRSDDTDRRVKEMVESNGLDFPVLLDEGPTERAYRIEIMPTLFLIDSDGKIARVFKGKTEANVLRQAFRRVD